MIGLVARVPRWTTNPKLSMTVEVGKSAHSLMLNAGLDYGLKNNVLENRALFNVFESMDEIIEVNAGPVAHVATSMNEAEDVSRMWERKFWETEADILGRLPETHPGMRFIGRRMRVLRESENLVFSLGRILTDKWNSDIRSGYGRVFQSHHIPGIGIFEKPIPSKDFLVASQTIEDIFGNLGIWHSALSDEQSVASVTP